MRSLRSSPIHRTLKISSAKLHSLRQVFRTGNILSDRFSSTLNDFLDHVHTEFILRVEIISKVHFLARIFAYSALLLVPVAFAQWRKLYSTGWVYIFTVVARDWPRTLDVFRLALFALHIPPEFYDVYIETWKTYLSYKTVSEIGLCENIELGWHYDLGHCWGISVPVL